MNQHNQDALKRVNFFVIGAAKCGTTTLYARLNAHPEVFLSPLKEPNYHSRADLDPTRFSKAFKANTKLDLTDYFAAPDPLAKMQVGFVREAADYARLFSGANDTHRIVGECSTSYLWSPSAPAAPLKTVLVNCDELSIATEPVKSPSGNCIDPEVPPEYPEPETDAVTDPDEPNPCEPMYLYTIE